MAFELPKPVHEKFRNPGRAPAPPTRLNWKILSLGYFDRQSKRYQVIESAKPVTPVVSGSEISYLQAFNGIDVNYTCANTRLKEELVLSQEGRDKLPDPGQYGISRANAFLVFATEFVLTPNNIRVFARADAGRVPVRQGNAFAFEGDDPIDFEDDDTNLHFFFPMDYAWAVNDSASDFAGKVSVKRYFYSDRGKHYLLIGVPYSWIISSPAGTLIIDPTISPTPSGDTWLESSTNNGTSTTLKIGKHTGAFKKRTLVKFNVSTVPISATVLNAQLKLYYYSASNGGSGAWVDRWVQVHQMLRNWNELQADSLKRLTGVNWLAPRAKIGPGADSTTADANGQFESTLLIQQSQYGYKSLDLTALTQKWVKVSGPGSAPNYGVILWATNEAVNGYDLWFFSGSTTPPANLTVTYSTQAKTVYFLKDHLGSIHATVQDSTGIPVRGYDDYDPWGYIMGGRSMASSILPSNATRNRFTSKEYDDEFNINWNYFGARYYDPQIGRWPTVDPLWQKHPDVTPYNYVLNNPLRLIDPDGKQVLANGGNLRPPSAATIERNLVQSYQEAKFFASVGLMEQAATRLGVGVLEAASGILANISGPGTEFAIPLGGFGRLGGGAAGEVKGLLTSGNKVANATGEITSEILDDSAIFYRAFGGEAGPVGEFLASSKPLSQAEAKATLALPESNTAEKVATLRVQGGVRIQRSTAKAAFNQPGGAKQVQLLETAKIEIIKEEPLP